MGTSGEHCGGVGSYWCWGSGAVFVRDDEWVDMWHNVSYSYSISMISYT